MTALMLAATSLAVTAVPAQAQAVAEDKALNRPVTASSFESNSGNRDGCNGTECSPDKANDGRADTRWGSAYRDAEHWTVDLGQPRKVDTVSIEWQRSFAPRYRISVALDSRSFTTVAAARIELSPAAKALLEVTRRFEHTVSFGVQTIRYLRVTGENRSKQYGISFWRASVFGPPDVELPAGPTTPTPPLLPAAPVPQVGPFNSSGPPTEVGNAQPPKQPAPKEPASGPSEPPRRLTPFPVVRIVGVATAAGASIRRFTVRAPRSAQVRVTCDGGGCPARTLRLRGPGRVRGIQRRLRVGAVVRVFVTQKNRVGKYTRFTIRKGQAPGRFDSCAMHGAKRPTPCPAS